MRIENSQITFADLEFLQQGVRLDPLLEKISDFLDNHDELEEIVRCDLERDLKEPETGRPGLTPGQVLRSLILMRIKDGITGSFGNVLMMDTRCGNLRASRVLRFPGTTLSIMHSTG